MSRDIPGLIGMDILTSQYRNKSIFRLNLGGRQLIIDNDDIDIDRQGHLHLPDNLAKISSSFTPSNSKTNTAYFQDEDISCDGFRGRQLPGVGQERRLEDPLQPPRRKTPDKGKLRSTLPDIKLPEDSNKRLRKKDYDRPDVIAAKNAELEKFFKFNVIKSVPRAPRGAEVMRTTWVITEKSDNMSKTGSKIKARLCTMGNSTKEFPKDSVQFESPNYGRDTVKALLSLVPDNKWCIATFDVSLALFQGDSLQREVYVKDLEGPGFWVLNAALYGLREGACNWYDRFHRLYKLRFYHSPRRSRCL